MFSAAEIFLKLHFFQALVSLLLNICIHTHIHRMWRSYKTGLRPKHVQILIPKSPVKIPKALQTTVPVSIQLMARHHTPSFANPPRFYHDFMYLQIQIRHAFVIYSVLLVILQFKMIQAQPHIIQWPACIWMQAICWT